MNKLERTREAVIFDELLKDVGNSHQKLRNKYDSFLAMIGRKYKGDLMVVGRSVNGWYGDWSSSDVRDLSKRKEIIQETLNSVHQIDDCPMLWVTSHWSTKQNYNTARSSFWRVIRKVVKKLEVVDENQDLWPSSLIWSNLYKISPHSGGNPNTTLCNIQFKYCMKILHTELSIFKPRKILFLTGIDWASPFLGNENVKTMSDIEHTYVESFGTINMPENHFNAQFVVSKHPQCKPEDKIIQEIIETFEKLRDLES